METVSEGGGVEGADMVAGMEVAAVGKREMGFSSGGATATGEGVTTSAGVVVCMGEGGETVGAGVGAVSAATGEGDQ